MSALNILRQKDAVHLLTDGAAYGAGGEITFTRSKVMHAANISAAISIRGPQMALPLIGGVLTMVSSFDLLKANASRLVKDLCEQYRDVFAKAEIGGGNIDVVVAGWSETAGPDSYVICNRAMPGIEPWAVMDTGPLGIIPGNDDIYAEAWDALSLARGTDHLDAERDGLALLEIQRRHPIKVDGDAEFSICGGFAELTTVTLDMITSKVLKRWPDKSLAAS